MKNLVFRRQFILTNQKIQVDNTWRKTHISRNSIQCMLYTHPDLPVTHKSTSNADLFLLGYVLNPLNPEHSNSDILDTLSKSDSFSSITAGTEKLTGRYALIYIGNNTINVLHDATGFREVFFYSDKGVFACGSTPNIISEYLKIDRDDDKELNRFFNSPQLNSPERKWIGHRTIFKGISKLLPNHFVDLLKNKTYRYWPIVPREIKKINIATDYAAQILTGTYDSAIKRFNIYQTLTGGWDTRLMLAACRKHTSKVNFYFNRGFKSDKGLVNSPDYLITKEIAERYKLPIEFITIDDLTVDPEFEKIYYSNNILARPKLLKVYYDRFLRNTQNCVTVSGTEGNSLLRLKSSLNRDASQAETFAGLFGYSNFPFVVKSIDEWLQDAKHLKKMNYILSDLFYWEQNFANWGTLSGSEQDIVWDELRPFNNRALISTFGSLDDRYRYKDYPESYVKIINKLWPELLDFHIETKNYALKKVLRTINMEQLADKVFQKIKAV